MFLVKTPLIYLQVKKAYKKYILKINSSAQENIFLKVTFWFF